jgi:ribonuclease BN (tRNA processing enzyme)
MLKITMLGTSHGDPTDSRFNTSTLLQVDDGSYLIDAGAPVNALLTRMKFKFDSLKAIFLTHMHEDHVGGLSGMVKTLAKHSLENQHTDIFFPEVDAIAGFKAWMDTQHREISPKVISYHASSAGELINYKTTNISAIPTDHLLSEKAVSDSFAYKFNTPYGKILFTGDLRYDFSDFPVSAARDCRICVCELTHYPLKLAIPLLLKCNFEKLIFTHIGDNWAGEEGQIAFTKLTNQLPYPCVISNDSEQFQFN